jgi:VCBS repeat-containing protein
LSDSVTYTATDGTTTSSASLTITIQGHTDVTFTAVDDTADIIEDATPDTVSGNVLTNDNGGGPVKAVTAVNSDPANVGMSVVVAHGTFLINADGSFTYTLNNADPDVNALNDGDTLTDSISYTAVAGSQAPQPPVQVSNATLTVTIHGHTDVTFNAVDDTAEITEDATPDSVTGNVLTNDTNPAGATSVTAVNGSAGNVGTAVAGQFGTFQINSNGTFTYTLDNSNATVDALNDGQALTDSVTYTATDGTTISSATLKILIDGHTD